MHVHAFSSIHFHLNVKPHSWASVIWHFVPIDSRALLSELTPLALSAHLHQHMLQLWHHRCIITTAIRSCQTITWACSWDWCLAANHLFSSRSGSVWSLKNNADMYRLWRHIYQSGLTHLTTSGFTDSGPMRTMNARISLDHYER